MLARRQLDVSTVDFVLKRERPVIRESVPPERRQTRRELLAAMRRFGLQDRAVPVSFEAGLEVRRPAGVLPGS